MSNVFHPSLPIILLLLVFVAIAVRKIGRLPLPIWLTMLTAAGIVLITGHISPTPIQPNSFSAYLSLCHYDR